METVLTLSKAFDKLDGGSEAVVTNTQALSHAWGYKKFLTLTFEDFEQFRQATPVTPLSFCFQDALYMTTVARYQPSLTDDDFLERDEAGNYTIELK